MLCDDILREGIRDQMYDPVDKANLVVRIGSATKFVLSRDFAQAADELSSDLTEVAKALPFCRLPFAEVWIEVAQNDRRNFIDGKPPDERFEVVPVRVGYLLTASNDELSAWKAHLFWRVPRRDSVSEEYANNIAAFAMNFDMSGGFGGDGAITEHSGNEWRRATPEAREMLVKVVQPTLPDYKLNVSLLTTMGMGMNGRAAEVAEFLMARGRCDWAGEPAYIEATLALLNARNASMVERVDNTAYNIKRAKRGHPPLASHHLLKIHPRQLVKIRSNDTLGRDRELRAHFVRGHWKTRKTGVYFWRPFLRGDRKRGEVSKIYEVD